MDPNEINNHNQINRVATPIKINGASNPITNPNNVVVVSKKNKKQSSITTVFVIIFLLLLALISFLIFYIIVPNINLEKNNNRVIDKTTTTRNIDGSFTIASGPISENPLINEPGEYIVSNRFKINTLKNGNSVNVLVNNRLIDSGKYLHSSVALVHDLILITITKGIRDAKFYAVSVDGEIVYELNQFSNDGMILNSDVAIQYNSASIIFNSTRVLERTLILDSSEGNINGINICNYELLGENSVDENFAVISNYAIEYLGNHQFSAPKLINSVNLADYRNQNNYCN